MFSYGCPQILINPNRDLKVIAVKTAWNLFLLILKHLLYFML